MGTQLSVKIPESRMPILIYAFIQFFRTCTSMASAQQRFAPPEYSYFFSSFGSGIARTVWITLFSTFMILRR